MVTDRGLSVYVPAVMRTIRRALCRIGIHRWQLLYEPPHIATTGVYRKALFCIHCAREAPWGPGELNR